MAQIERELKTDLVAALASITVETENDLEMKLAEAVMAVITERSDSKAFQTAWRYVVTRGDEAFSARIMERNAKVCDTP